MKHSTFLVWWLETLTYFISAVESVRMFVDVFLLVVVVKEEAVYRIYCMLWRQLFKL